MAMMAAMKKVLSPSSETMMTEIAATKAWINPRLPLLGSSGLTAGAAGWPVGTFCTKKRHDGYCFDTNLCQCPHVKRRAKL